MTLACLLIMFASVLGRTSDITGYAGWGAGRTGDASAGVAGVAPVPVIAFAAVRTRTCTVEIFKYKQTIIVNLSTHILV